MAHYRLGSYYDAHPAKRTRASQRQRNKKAVLLAIMTKRNSRNPRKFTVEKVAVVRNTVHDCTHKGDDITDVVAANLPRFEAALKTRENR